MDLRTIAAETVRIVDSGGYDDVDISDSVRAAVAGTILHLPGDTIPLTGEPNESPSIEVVRESTLAAARRLTDGASLVFASAKNPGGGFLSGARAQEESIARASALYACQLTQPAFYEHHRRSRDLRYSDHIIYSPGVPMFRDDRGALLDTPYQTAMLTAAAPNLGAIRRNQPHHAATVPQVLRTRAVRILEVAAYYRHRELVLGAWGCGVFRNDPELVADAFSLALQKVPYFDRVIFAILDNLPQSPVLHTFTARFAA